MSAGSPSSLDSISPRQGASAPQAAGEKRRLAIGIAVLLGCFLVGAGVIWWFFYGSAPTKTQVRVDPKEQTLGYGRRGGRHMPQPRAISHLGANGWLVRGSKGQMKVKKADGAIEVGSFSYVGGLGVSEEQLTLLTSRWRILRDPAMAKAWGITPAQRSKLSKLKGAGGFDPTKAQREELTQLFLAYQNASDGTARGDAERKVLDQIDLLAGGSFDASRAAYVQRADQIRQILTAKQIKKILKR